MSGLNFLKMSVGIPSIHPQLKGTSIVKDDVCGPYGVPQRMLTGFSNNSSAKSKIAVGHPLEFSEKQVHEAETLRDYDMLRNVQGLYAPLHLEMERRIAGRMLRLPCMPSSNLLLDSLTGRLDTIEFDDILNDPNDAERAGYPHIMTERKLGLL